MTALLETCVAPVLFWSCKLPFTVLPMIVVAAVLFWTWRSLPNVLPAHEAGVAEPIWTAVPLFWNTTLPCTVAPQIRLWVDEAGRLLAVKFPLIVVDGPIEKVPPAIWTFPVTVAPERLSMPPAEVTFPVMPHR